MSRRSVVYVGRLARDTSERDLDRAFSKFGRVESISMRSDFAFIVCLCPCFGGGAEAFRAVCVQDFEDGRDADDAVHDMDGVCL